MSFDGSHIICESCSEARFYSDAAKKWLCAKCNLDKIE